MPPSVFFPIFVRFIKAYRVSQQKNIIEQNQLHEPNNVKTIKSICVFIVWVQLAEEENEQRRRQEQMLLEKLEQEEQQDEEETKVRLTSHLLHRWTRKHLIMK